MNTKKLSFSSIKDKLSRSELKSIMAGTGGASGGGGGSGQCYVTCCGCVNSLCQGWVDDCFSGVYQICGPGPWGGSGPCATCTC